jgi:putative ABC transport system permease protein
VSFALQLREAVRLAFAMIRAHKLRAFFTVVGTVVGVTFLIAVITLIEGMNRYMEEDFAGQIYGFNTVMLRRVPSVQIDADAERWRAWGRRPRLTIHDAEWLEPRTEVPGTLAYSSDRGGQLAGPGGIVLDNVRVIGASATYFGIRDLDLEVGRAFSAHEAQRGVPVAVIGRDVADRLFERRNPLEKVVRIEGFPYRVIGVLEKQGSLFGMSLDQVVIAPARSALNGFVSPHDEVEEITFRVPDARYIGAAMADLEGLMRVRRRLRPGEPNDFEVETAAASLSFWTRISRVMMIALPGLVGISLVVGAVVIMNIMLVSVTERTREIGVRKALGARKRDIVLQFMVEAGTLSGIGGLIGIGLGIALAALVSSVSPIPAQVAPWSIALAIVLGVGVGLVAGVYPAARAAGLDPIAALRQE